LMWSTVCNKPNWLTSPRRDYISKWIVQKRYWLELDYTGKS